MARTLDLEAYGGFALAYSLLLFFGSVYSAVFIEPMLVFGVSRFQQEFSTYKRILIAMGWRFGIGVSLVFLLLALLWRSKPELAASFLGHALAAPLIYFLWLERRSVYVSLNLHRSILGGAIYLLIYVIFVVVMAHFSLLNPFLASLVMGLAALVAALSIAHLGNPVSPPASSGGLSNKQIFPLHWRYGRWALLTGLLSWAPGYLPLHLLTIFQGLEAAARFTVLQNLMMPILHFNGALAQLLLPALARSISTQGQTQGVRVAYRGFGVLASTALVYWLLIWIGGEKVIRLLYGERYVEDAWLLAWLGFGPLLGAAVLVLTSFLRARENPRAVASAYAFSLALGLFLMPFLTWKWGIFGAVLALLFIEMLYVLGLSYAVWGRRW